MSQHWRPTDVSFSFAVVCRLPGRLRRGARWPSQFYGQHSPANSGDTQFPRLGVGGAFAQERQGEPQESPVLQAVMTV